MLRGCRTRSWIPTEIYLISIHLYGACEYNSKYQWTRGFPVEDLKCMPVRFVGVDSVCSHSTCGERLERRYPCTFFVLLLFSTSYSFVPIWKKNECCTYNMTGYVWRSICSPSCPCKWLLSGTKQCVTGKMHNDSYWGESSRLKQSVTKDSKDPQEHCSPVWRPPRHYFPSFNLSKFFLNPCKHLIPTKSCTMSLCCLSLLLKHLLFIMNLPLLT